MIELSLAALGQPNSAVPLLEGFLDTWQAPDSLAADWTEAASRELERIANQPTTCGAELHGC